MKQIILVTLTALVTSQALASFNPRKPADPVSPRTSFLNCVGADSDFPRASITYYWMDDSYTVSEDHDLDVPGGAGGTTFWRAKGTVSPDEIHLTDGRRVLIGKWNGSAYQVSIRDGNLRTEHTCVVERF